MASEWTCGDWCIVFDHTHTHTNKNTHSSSKNTQHEEVCPIKPVSSVIWRAGPAGLGQSFVLCIWNSFTRCFKQLSELYEQYETVWSNFFLYFKPIFDLNQLKREEIWRPHWIPEQTFDRCCCLDVGAYSSDYFVKYWWWYVCFDLIDGDRNFQ